MRSRAAGPRGTPGRQEKRSCTGWEPPAASSKAVNWPSVASRAGSGILLDRKSTRLNSSHGYISYAVFCLKKKKLTRCDCVPHLRASQAGAADDDDRVIMAFKERLDCAVPLVDQGPPLCDPHTADALTILGT